MGKTDMQIDPAIRDLSGHDKELCFKVLALCAPCLSEGEKELALADPKSWLDALSEHLIANMYPDEAHERRPFSEDEMLYLEALESTFSQNLEEFDPLTDLIPVEESTIQKSRVAREYRLFEEKCKEAHLLALMRITREIRPFDTASHVIGVHNVALHMAILADRAGFPVDLPLVSAAALAHDIGKFGCRGADAQRVPYFHYYYTWQWFSENGMEDIGHISANHSTWDLEFENLPIESLLLIYADFRVRGTRDAANKEIIRIYSLQEAYQMIFSKLYNMTPEKERRYKSVYLKLQDFEIMLTEAGVSPDIEVHELKKTKKKDASLLTQRQALQALRTMALKESGDLMRTVSTDRAFGQLLEQAKSEKTLHRIRTYLLLFREYNTYLTKDNKKKLLVLLYELLTHPDGDVRRISADLMGQVLANSGPKYRKERPGAVDENASMPAMMALLDESLELWKHYIDLCLYPEKKSAMKHTRRARNSLKVICASLLRNCDKADVPQYLEPVLDRLIYGEEEIAFNLVDTLSRLDEGILRPEDVRRVLFRLRGFLDYEDSVELALCTLRTLLKLQKTVPECEQEIRALLKDYEPERSEYYLAFRYLKLKIMGEEHPDLTEENFSDLYLSNLKNAVHWTAKLTQIELLNEKSHMDRETALHAALHFSNLLSVSEHLPVREAAGRHLLEIVPLLTVHQINEITIDLCRELETGQEQITRFITPYIGRLICMLPNKEMYETLLFMENMVHGELSKSAGVALRVLGEVVTNLVKSGGLDTVEGQQSIDHILGLLMTGVSHYKPEVHQIALRVFCRDIFSNDSISLETRGMLFIRMHKKLLTILSESRSGNLTVFNTAAMLNQLYRFITEYEVHVGRFHFEKERPVAFFPGTFDPFSIGHKQIVDTIRKKGFEVFLAIDEFSWSKKTLPKLQRRQITGISVADQWNTCLFPDDIPINIAMPRDLKKLKSLFPGRTLYLVAGSDVILNASAYREPKPGGAAEFNHIVFYRHDHLHPENEKQQKDILQSRIHGQLELMDLPEFYETVSSTRIREAVDQKMDISMLVDPVVQTYIYDNGLYVRTPESKEILSRQSLYFTTYRRRNHDLPEVLRKPFCQLKGFIGVTLQERTGRQVGWAAGHMLHVSNMYDTLGSFDSADYVRKHTAGRTFWVDDVCVEKNNIGNMDLRDVLNELLARSLDDDHTYALCRCKKEQEELKEALLQLGFTSIPNDPELYAVDMSRPVMLLQDLMLCIKSPLQDSARLKNVVHETRKRLRSTLTAMFEGNLLLCFDSAMLNQSLQEKVEKLNGVYGQEEKKLGPAMCVPYGKILSDVYVPNTVTKTLHVEKCFHADLRGFNIEEYPGYSPLRSQVRMLKSFQRPIILVDDLLHNGYRINKLDKNFREEGLHPERIVVAVMSGRGRDLMQMQKRKADWEYFIPNLHYWVTESILYPFIGGDSIETHTQGEGMIPSVNLILPYYYPNYFQEMSEDKVYLFSGTCLANAKEIVECLEEEHEKLFSTPLTIRRLNEALHSPRLPEQRACMKYDFTLPASDYLKDDLVQLERICKRPGFNSVTN